MVKDILSALFIVVLLGAGAASILLVSRLYRKYRFAYLQSWFYYQLLVVAYGVYGLIGSLLIQRILQSIASPPQLIVTVGQFIPFLGVPFLITGLYMFLKICVEIHDHHLPRNFTYGYFGFHLFFFLVYGIIILKMPQTGSQSYSLFPPLIRISLVVLQSIILIIGVLLLFRGAKKLELNSWKRTLHTLGLLFALIQVAGIALFELSDLSIYLTIAYLFIYFTGNLPPLLLIGTYLSKYWKAQPSLSNIRDLSDFYGRYAITRREREIIELIVQGKTNQEIADKLFITLQTVKDHTHNIYIKLDVRNRVELSNMLGNFPASFSRP